jgi:PKD repeat protein
VSTIAVAGGATGAIDPNATILKTHPHEGAVGTAPSPSAEGYSAGTGSAAVYSATADVGSSSIEFTGAATYFDDNNLNSTTGQLVWSAPVQLPTLPTASGGDRFLLMRAGTTPLAGVEIGPGGQLQIKNGPDKLVAAGSTDLAAATWYTLDASLSGGAMTLRLFDADGSNLIETVGPATVTGGTPTSVRAGLRKAGSPILIDEARVASSWVTQLGGASPPPSTVAFVGQAGYNGASSTPSVTLPAGISAGDTELLAVTTNTAGVTTSPPSGSGWTKLVQKTAAPLEVTLFERAGSAGDSASMVTVPLTSSVMVDLQFVDYSGVDSSPPVVTTASDASTHAHVTPAATVSVAGSWGVSFWADKNSSANTAWSFPASVTARGSGIGVRSNHVDTAIADSAAGIATGTYGRLGASTDASTVSGKGITMTVILAPGAGTPPANRPPTASATSSCQELTCSFDGSGSSDSDGTVASYVWDFGDQSQGSGENPTHVYAEDGTFTVSLIVTDNDGAASSPWTGSVTVSSTAPPPPPTGPCGSLSSSYDPANPPAYKHIIVIMEENLDYATWNTSPQTSYTRSLAAQCGDETNFHNATHPSQPNYMALSSGEDTGVGVMTKNDNIFHQLQTSGGTWKNYAESMSTPCSSENSLYKPGHTPAYWYSDLRSPTNACAANDVPMDPALDNDIANDSLPTFSWLSPNECNAYYYVAACGGTKADRVPKGEAWLQMMIPRLTAMPSYQNGDTLILITYDEGQENAGTGLDCTSAASASRPDCHIPTIVMSDYLAPGSTDASNQNLYSLGGTIADILDQPRLGNEIGQPNMRATLPF